MSYRKIKMIARIFRPVRLCMPLAPAGQLLFQNWTSWLGRGKLMAEPEMEQGLGLLLTFIIALPLMPAPTTPQPTSQLQGARGPL